MPRGHAPGHVAENGTQKRHRGVHKIVYLYSAPFRVPISDFVPTLFRAVLCFVVCVTVLLSVVVCAVGLWRNHGGIVGEIEGARAFRFSALAT